MFAQVSFSLSPASPGSGYLCEGSQNEHTFTLRVANSGGAAVAMQSFSFERVGISSYQTVNQIRLYNNGVQVGPSFQFNSGNTATLTNLNFVVAPGSTQDFELRVDVAVSTGGQTIGVKCYGAQWQHLGTGSIFSVLLNGVQGNMFFILNCQQPPILNLTADGSSNTLTVPCGTPVHLQWNINNAISASLSFGGGSSLVIPIINGNGGGGTVSTFPVGTTNLVLTAVGGNGMVVTRTITIVVQATPFYVSVSSAPCMELGYDLAGYAVGCSNVDTVALALSFDGVNWDTIPYFSFDQSSNMYHTYHFLSVNQILYYKYVWLPSGSSNWVAGSVSSVSGSNIVGAVTSLTSSQTTVVATTWLDNTPNQPTMVFLLKDTAGVVVDSQQIAAVWNSQLSRCEYTYIKTGLTVGTQYALKMQSQVWCTTWSDSVVIATDSYGVGIEDATQNNFVVYPNPAQNEVTIKFSDVESGAVQISSLDGKVVFEQTSPKGEKELKLNISLLPNAMYIVSANGQYSKLIINK